MDANAACDAMNLNESKNIQPNVGMVKEEAEEADDILLQHEKLGNVSTDDQLASTSLSTFESKVISNRLLELKTESLDQDCEAETDENISIKRELLHEELHIKSEDETVQEPCLEDTDNLGNQISKHTKLHTGDKHFKCHICNSRFTLKCHLKTHLKIHKEEKPFKCNTCGYTCVQKCQLKKHLKYHTGEKPFKCNICNYTSVESSNLKRHLKTHTGEKPFKCNICNSSFREKCTLKTHLRTHTEEKPFKCNTCGYACVRSGTLKRHLQSHTGEPFKCNTCIYNCVRSGTMTRHLKSHTGEKL